MAGEGSGASEASNWRGRVGRLSMSATMLNLKEKRGTLHYTRFANRLSHFRYVSDKISRTAWSSPPAQPAC